MVNIDLVEWLAGIDLAGWLGIGGFILAVINSGLMLWKHWGDRPIIKIEKKGYLKHKKGYNLTPVQYAQKAIRGDFNNGALNYGVRELVVSIANNGHQDARLKGVSPVYFFVGGNFSPEVIIFTPTTIVAGDREEVHLFFEFPLKIIEKIEETSPNTIEVVFDFAHKKIREKFVI